MAKTLKGLVFGGKMAHFVRYQAGFLIYDVEHFEFPIPIEDTGTGTFPRNIKAVTLMRWIRKHLSEIDES